jgi:prolyl oligopeptidase
MRIKLDYPKAECLPQPVVYGDVSYEDAFRWLEEDTERAVSWQTAQDVLTTTYLSSLPSYTAFSERLGALGDTSSVMTPKFAGGRWFSARVPDGEDLYVLEVAESASGPGRPIMDLNALSTGEPLKFDSFLPAPDGRKVVVGWSAAGRELENFQILDVDTGELLLERVPQKRVMNCAWLPNSTGLYYMGYDAAVSMTQGRIYLHLLGKTPPTQPEALDLRHPVARPMAAADGRYMLLYLDHLYPRPDFIKQLRDGGGWRPFLKDMPGMFRGDILGERFVAITDDSASRGRLVSIPLSTPMQRETWQELVPASDSVLVSVMIVGERIVLLDLVDTYARLRVLRPDGALEGEVALPGGGVVNTFGGPYSMVNMVDCLARAKADEILFVFSSPTESPALYSADVVKRSISRLTEPAVRLDARVHDRSGLSADATTVRFRVVARTGANLSIPAPTVIFGYGGFNVAFLPGWVGTMFAAWIQAGGVVVLAHLRGGGEFGSQWWQEGRLKCKQNTFNDVYAIAEEVIRSGISSPQQLAVLGGSNGGTMAAAAAVQRPDLFQATVPQVPITDVLGRLRDPISMASTLDYGDPLDPVMSKVLRAWSPYQNITDGVAYPSVLIDSGLNDPRCPPWHGRKFAARLQQASSSSRPVLLRVRAGAGHGAVGRGAQHLQEAETLAFLAEQLALTL